MGNLISVENILPFQPSSFIELVDSMGSEDSIVRSARVSFNNDRTGYFPERDAKLVKYLRDNAHWSPFEHVVFTFHVGCPVFVAREWQRHKSWSFSEVSARYTAVTDSFYMPEWREQSKKNRQGSDEVDPELAACAEEALSGMDEAMGRSYEAYIKAMEAGLAREVARCVLPVGMYTRFYATASLRSIIHFLQQRMSPLAQKEIRLYAETIHRMLIPDFPNALGGLVHHD